MKLKIKYKKDRKDLNVADNLSVQDLVESAKALHGLEGNFLLSLNGKQPIGKHVKIIKDSDIRSGDIVYLIEDDNTNEGIKIIEEYLGIKKYDSTEEFNSFLQERDCKTEADYLILFTHGLLQKRKFEVRGSSEKPNHFLESLPTDWKTSGTFYKLCYIYKGVNVDCNGLIAGKYLTINGVIITNDMKRMDSYSSNESMETDDDNNDHEPHNVKLKISDYIVQNQAGSDDPRQIYKNVKSLVRKIEEDFVGKLTDDIKAIEESKKVTLLSLPDDLIIGILRHLDVRDIAHAALVSKSFKRITNHEKLWKYMLFKEINIINPDSKSYKEAVKKLWQLKEEKKREDKEKDDHKTPPLRTPRRPEFNPVHYQPTTNFYPDSAGPVRGIIGGTRDLYPGPIPQQGGFPNYGFPGAHGPDLLQGRPFGARYNPIDPFDGYNRDRRGHPDMLRRPGGFDPYYDDDFI